MNNSTTSVLQTISSCCFAILSSHITDIVKVLNIEMLDVLFLCFVSEVSASSADSCVSYSRLTLDACVNTSMDSLLSDVVIQMLRTTTKL